MITLGVIAVVIAALLGAPLFVVVLAGAMLGFLAAEIDLSPSSDSLSRSSIDIPRAWRFSQDAFRTSELFSPIPPVKTTASRPPMAAVYAPMYFLIR